MIFLKEIYKENISPKVIEEYEQYIKNGLIRVYNPIDEDGSEDDSNPVWEIVELTEEELLERIAEAKEREEELLKDMAEGKVHYGSIPCVKDISFIFGDETE